MLMYIHSAFSKKIWSKTHHNSFPPLGSGPKFSAGFVERLRPPYAIEARISDQHFVGMVGLGARWAPSGMSMLLSEWILILYN